MLRRDLTGYCMKISRAEQQCGQKQSRTGVGEELLVGCSQEIGVYCVNIFIIGYLLPEGRFLLKAEIF